MKDSYNRSATYLRIGVTDKCNLRCRYCMPAEGIDFSHRSEILSYEEILRLAPIFKGLGVDKVRLTGGEPFVRKDIDLLLRGLKEYFDKLYITSNATLLEPYLDLIQDLGISGLNISIDSLSSDRFFMITRRDVYDQVMRNIMACIHLGIPIKLNVVVMKGVNDMEILDFLKFGIENKVEVRFIEAMPFNEDDGNHSVFMPLSEIHTLIAETYPEIKAVSTGKISSSEHFEIRGYRFGIIPAYTRSLCASCNRIRLTPKGEFLTCLYANNGLDLKQLLRNGSVSDDQIKAAITSQVSHKKKTGMDEEALRRDSIFNSMTTIGG